MRRSKAPSIRKPDEYNYETISKNDTQPESSVKENLSENTGFVKFNVVYGKVSGRKHKIYEDDGTLEFSGCKSAILRDSNGRIIGSSMSIKTVEIFEGAKMVIGSKEVEVIDRVNENKTSKAVIPKKPNIINTLRPSSPPRKMFKCPMPNSSSPAKKIPEKIALPDRFIMPAPPYEHQWTFNPTQKPLTDVVVAQSLTAVLRPHQKEGVSFLYKCVMGFNLIGPIEYFGCILADEMGLGKTLQCITLFHTLLKGGPYSINVAKRILIVTPSTLLENWNREIEKWLKNERMYTFIVDGKKNKVQNFKQSAHIPIMLISYEMLTKHSEEMETIHFDLMICDEGHRLKSEQLKVTVSLDKMDCKRRILLTGTPFQNDMQEYYTLINFVNPNVLGSYQEFKIRFETPILQSQQSSVLKEYRELGAERNKELNEITSKFILRRTQEIINQYLPKKQELVIFVKPSSLQKKLIVDLLGIYDQQKSEMLLEKNLLPLEMIISLKKLCNHPSLLQCNNSSREKEVAKLMNIKIPQDIRAQDSGKLLALTELLEELIVKKEKIVIISYFTKTLDVLQNVCNKHCYKNIRLDGSTKNSERLKNVTLFNDPETDIFVFLLSAKSGGTGLNLIGASRLMMFDNDWNPSNDSQAMARIWRDGQKRDVFIYRMITSGTIEEKIFQRQITKTSLSDQVIDTVPINQQTKFTSDELKALFQVDEDGFECCQTHDIIECRCDGSGNIPEAEEDCIENLDVEDSDEDSLQLNIFMRKPEKKSALKQHELVKWEHHKYPVAEKVLAEICLQKCQRFITFIFRNQTISEKSEKQDDGS